MELDLAFVWAGLIAFAVLAYVVLDGFDLGVGILFPLIEGEANKDLAINTVAPVWDGNETWLILGGGGLFAVFPLAYAVVMPALYAPIIAMLLALVFRGVAFEFRWRTRRGKVPLGPLVLRRLARRRLRARGGARRAGRRHRGRGPRLCRRALGLADAVLDPDRGGARRRLRACSAPPGW